MRKMLITLALVAAPVLAAAQSAQQPDTSKAKPKTTQTSDTSKKKPARHAAKKAPTDTSKAKPKAAAPASTDTTKKPN